MSAAGTIDWTVFVVLVAALLVVDMTLASRGTAATSVRRAWKWTALWIAAAIAFGVWIWSRLGTTPALEYATAYVLEKSLSIDNLAVFALVFSQTGIVGPLQRKVLMWGVIGALVMRAALIGAGLFLLTKFQWIVYPMAALLLYGALQMARHDKERRLWVETTCTLCSSWIGRLLPISKEQHADRLTVRIGGARYATPLLVALIAVESADAVFAIDSIPAVFAVTQDPFLVYTSNVFALLGLRSIYAIVGNVFERFPYVRYALAALLVFVAIKLGASAFVHITPAVSLGVIVGLMLLAAAATRWLPAPRQAVPPLVACTHRDQDRGVVPKDTGCTECKAIGDTWVSLRVCLACGNVGCCESSKNDHAHKHFTATGHAIMRSLEPGETWRWCYVDNGIIAYD
jgi:tellurite resistance protein TerC